MEPAKATYHRDDKTYKPLNLEVVRYCEKVHDFDTSDSEMLQKVFNCPKGNDIPEIMLHPLEGQCLRVLIKAIQAKKIVEIGTLVGYSALCMAKGMPADGHIWTLEFSPKHAAVAKRNFAMAGETGRISVVEGAARVTLKELEKDGPFDVVFIDADKVNYEHYAAWAVDNLRKGGLLIADNSFYFNKLVNAEDEEAASMRRFHAFVAAHLVSATFPSPEGMVIGVKD